MQRVQAAALRWSFRLVDAGVVVVAFVLTAWAREAAVGLSFGAPIMARSPESATE